MKASIDQLCDQFGGSLLESANGLLVLDPPARRVCRVAGGLLPGTGTSDPEAFVTQFFEWCRDQPPTEPTPGVEMHYVGPVPLTPPARDAIDRLVQAGEDRTYAVLVLHVTEFQGPLEPTLAAYEGIPRLYSNVSVRGRIPEDLTPEEGSLIARSAVKLYEVAGWWPGCDPEGADRIDVRRIEKVGRLGVRVPVLWYAHKGNVAAILDRLEEVLAANYYAGFAIEPVSASGLYRGNGADPEPPTSDEYCRLLVEAYRRYPHYDDVFLPLNMLAHAVGEGAWSDALDVPVPMKVLVREDGSCGLFRQVPAMATPWLGAGEAARLAPEALLEQLLAAARLRFNLASNEFCKDCRWRFLCGGMDRFLPSDALGERHAKLICDYRTLFIESFIRQAYPFDENENPPT